MGEKNQRFWFRKGGDEERRRRRSMGMELRITSEPVMRLLG